MTIGSAYTEPGAYSQFNASGNQVTLPGGVRVAAFIGDGRQTNIVYNQTVTRGGTANGSDALPNTATVLGSTIVDQDFVTYSLTTDYVLTSGAISWSPASAASITGTIAQTYNGLVGKTFKLTIGTGAEQTYTFVTGDFSVPTAATAAEVVTAINTNFTGVTASVDTSKVKVATTATSNSSIYIGAGTANSILGFTEGSVQYTPKEPAAGKTYTISSYQYAKVSADYQVRFFSSMADVIAEHGDVSTSNTVSLACEIAFQQGASVVATCQLNPADGATIPQYQAALNKLAAVNGINIVVPMSTNPVLYSYVKSHVDSASSTLERKERTAIVGLSGSPSISTIQGYATSLADKRMVLVYPPSCTRYVGTNTTVSTLDGSFIAAAIAGVRTSSRYDVATPLDRKEIVGFETVTNSLLRSEMNQLAASGVTIIETINTLHRVRDGLTTSTASVEDKTYSVVEIVDYVAVNMRSVLETIFIGQKILTSTPAQVRSVTGAVLTNLVNNDILKGFQNISAEIDNTDSTQINVQFEISPVYPLKYILITFSINN